MDINRRGFLKVLGITGSTLVAGNSFGLPPENDSDKEFFAILYDSTRCVGCQSCEFACAEKNNLPEPEDYPDPTVVRETNESSRVVINSINTSNGEQFLRRSCNHCSQPACATSCLTKAMYKTEEGPVIWREDKCIGCRTCMIACPFDIPKFEYDSPNPKIQKCTMCYDRVVKGEMPACVEACPAEALMFGKRKDLIDTAKARIYADPKMYNHHIYGEHEVGGTGIIYLASVPFEELGLRPDLGDKPYPEFNKTFLYSVPMVLTLGPVFLLGLNNSLLERKNKIAKDKMN